MESHQPTKQPRERNTREALKLIGKFYFPQWQETEQNSELRTE